jgi:uncharacterized membrane protein
MDQAAPITPRVRLKFIDLARSVAILLMLEGHFVGLTLAEDAIDRENWIYVFFHFLRGLTAPLFFTVAGMIFVFLMAGEKDTPFLKRVRVRKGIIRAGELLFWGYALQAKIINIPHYLHGEWELLALSFHVLQCIGVGLLALILIAGAHRVVKKYSLTTWYAVAAIMNLAVHVWLCGLPDERHIPNGWPVVIQNAVQGPNSVFPVAPWLGFAFLGGAMGAYVSTNHHQVATLRSCAWFFLLAASLKLVWLVAVLIPIAESASEGLAWITGRASEVVALLGILRVVEVRYGIGMPWLLRVGRETFAIYILHVIVLYGGLFGIGLNNVLHKNLGAWQTTGGAVIFITLFVVFASVWNSWKASKHAKS